MEAPLSFAQRRLWFLHRFDPDGFAYNIGRATRLRGRLDAAALRAAHDFVQARHEILRTRYLERNGVPISVVDPPAPADFESIDVSGLPEHEREGALEATLTDLGNRLFDLESGPVWRSALIRVGPEDHLLATIVHHIAADGWSFPILRAEIGAFYRSRVDGVPLHVPELAIQYRHYAQWQLDEAEQGGFEAGLQFWKEQLTGPLDPTELPADRPRPPRQTANGDWVPFEVDVSAGVVADLAGRWGASPFMVCFALFAAFLHRYTGAEDLVVGIPSAERTLAATQPLVGFFVNTLPIRVRVDGSMALRSVVESVRRSVLAALDHRNVPFDQVVEHLQPTRDPSRSPIVQIMFQHLNVSFRSDYGLTGIVEAPFPLPMESAKFDFLMELGGTTGNLHGVVNYNTDLFSAATIRRVLGHFGNLSRAAVLDSERPIARLPLLEGWEHRWLVEDLNRTRCPYPADRSLTDVFGEIAARYADRIAVSDGPLEVTYAELAGTVESLAEQLRSAGVGPGVAVGLRLPRSAALVASMLAVRRAGGVYVPLDPVYPDGPLRYMIEDSGATVVVGPASGRDWAAVEIRPISGAGPARLDPDLRPVYVMYTSGSTGRPKGVVVPERAILRLVLDTDYVTLGPGDVVAHLSNTSFDAATFEVWGAMLNGARLLILDQDTVTSAARFAVTLQRGHVTTLFVTAALFDELARHDPGMFATCTNVLFGGEPADPAAVRRVLHTGPPSRLINAYGPTESTTFAAWHLVTEVPEEAVTIPIGMPVANTTLHVLDGALNPVPPGVRGELFIGGDGLAIGYLGDATLTVERFVPDPFSSDPAGRLYRTGDLVKRRADGAIEFIGRLDRQVKLRGFRIEPGEVEACLGAHPEIVASVVRVVPVGGESQLTAYVVEREGAVVDTDQVKAFVRDRLPAFMVPTFVQRIGAIPRTPNGKINVAALPSPFPQARGDEPVGHERQVAGIWERILGVQGIGRHDNFFNLGGHSLVAVRLLSAVQQELGASLPLSALFESPTLAEFTARLDVGRTLAGTLVPIKAEGSLPPLFFFHPGGGNVFSYEAVARHVGAGRPVFGIQAKGVDGIGRPHRTVEEMADHYAEAILQARPSGPYHLAGWCSGGLIAYEVGRVLQEQGQHVATVALLDTAYPRRFTLFADLEREHPKTGNRRSLPIALLLNLWGAARRIAGKVRHGPRWLYYIARNRPIPPDLAGKRLVHISIRAYARYRPQPLASAITYFRAVGTRRTLRREGRDRPWSRVAGLGVDVIEVTATHPTIMQEPSAKVVGERLRMIMDEAEGVGER